MDILLTLALANELVVDVPADLVWGPLNGVGEPIGARVETGGVVMVLSTIFPDNVHGEGVLGDGWHDLDVNLVPAVRPVLSSVSEERLDCAHFHWVLHLSDELSVVEPLLGANLTGEVVSLRGTGESDDSGGQLLHLGLICNKLLSIFL